MFKLIMLLYCLGMLTGEYNYYIFHSPIGVIYVVSSRDGVVFLGGFNEFAKRFRCKNLRLYRDSIISETTKQLNEYFSLKRKVFNVRLDYRLISPFQLKVLRRVMDIPYGETRSYWFISNQIGLPRAQRIVGRMLALNPLIILIPCHRVIRKNGDIGGYSLGKNAKRFLLKLEKEGLKVN